MEEKQQEMSADISVVMPLYNARDYLKLTVDSILNQTHKNIEVVIVDDCSTDGSLELCRELYGHDERVKIIKQPQNAGPGAARNTGIRSATGDYITFMDSDDEVMPGTLQKMFEAAQKFNADVVHTTQFSYALPDEEGNMPLQLIDDSVLMFRNDIDRNAYTEVTLLSDDFDARLEDWKNRRINWHVCSKMIRREFLLSNNIFFSDMKLAEDMVFCFECLFRAKNYVIVPGGGYVYRITATSLSRGKKNSAHVIKAMKSQMGGVHNMSRILKEIPFFVANPDKAVLALERVIDDLEVSFIRPAFQELGEDTLRSDGLISEFMREQFGDNAPYVEFLFYELHKNYEPVIDYTAQLGDIEAWKALAQQLREKGATEKQ